MEQDNPGTVRHNEALSFELLSMKARDQSLREAMTVRCASGEPLTSEALVQAEFSDRVHTARMKEIIAEYGWPGHALAGIEGAAAAALLVLHADRDIAFQKQCLNLLRHAAESGDALARQVEFLTDRVCVNEGQPQRYGTQMQIQNGEWVLPGSRKASTAAPLPARDKMLGSGVQ